MRARSLTLHARPSTFTLNQNPECNEAPKPAKKLSPEETLKLFEDFGPLDDKEYKEGFSGDFLSLSSDNCSTAAPSLSVSMNSSQISTASNGIFEEEKIKKTFRGMIIGSRGTGKRSLVNAICSEDASNNSLLNDKQEFDLVTRREETEEAVHSYHFWLKEPQTKESYQPIIDTYYKACSAFIFVYDVHDKASFERLEAEIAKIKRVNSSKKVELILVGSKSSIGKREVETEEALRFKESHDIQLFSEREISSENITNIKEAIQLLLK